MIITVLLICVLLIQLLETIDKNGEFKRYVVMLTDREEQLHRDLRRRERERQRLIKGDDYVSDEESDQDATKEEEEDDYDDETDSEYDSENQSELQDAAVSDLMGVDGKSSVMRKKKNGASSRMSDGMDIQHRFNALRFLAMNLKS